MEINGYVENTTVYDRHIKWHVSVASSSAVCVNKLLKREVEEEEVFMKRD